MQLLVEVSVIGNLMSFVDHATHELRPPLCVRAENEKRRLDLMLGERVENSWSGIWIGAVVKRERYPFSIRRQLAEHIAEHTAVAVIRTVHESTDERDADGRD